jgi:hypothetical protein
MSDYGTAAGVAAYTKHLTANGVYTTGTKPPLADIETWLDERSAQINTWLAQAGYTTPVNVLYVAAHTVLSRYANIGAAGDAELSQRSGGYSADDLNARENKFLTEFMEVRDFILSGALAGMGVPQYSASSAIQGLYIGGRTSTGQALKPIFTRTSFGNNPTKESGQKEPGYDS